MKPKQIRKLMEVVSKVLDTKYYILPRRVLEMQKLPFYKQEFLKEIESTLIKKYGGEE